MSPHHGVCSILKALVWGCGTQRSRSETFGTHPPRHGKQGCIAVKNLFEFSIKVKFFRTTAQEVKDKFFREKLNYNFPQLSK